MTIRSGTVTWFSEQKGYGYVDDVVVVLATEIKDGGPPHLEPGDAVTFSLAETDRGPFARDVLRMP